ncbi:MAG: imidazolonepropionase, partial [Pseudomonadota bacterium]
MVYTDARLATMAGPENGPDYGMIDNGSVAVDAGRIAWVGREADLPQDYRAWQHVPLAGRLVTPGLVDCHTHIVFGGNRAREFELRLEGASYEEIARAGGGIVSTVTATRETGEADLLADALKRADALIAEGVTT